MVQKGTLYEYCVFITILMLKLNNSADEITGGVSIGCHCATHEYNNMFCPLCLSSQRMIQLTHITLSWDRRHVLSWSNYGVLTQGAATIELWLQQLSNEQKLEKKLRSLVLTLLAAGKIRESGGK